MVKELPIEFTNRMKELLGDDFDSFISSYDLPSVKALRLNLRSIDSVDFAHMSRISTGCDDPKPVDGISGAYYYDDFEPGKTSLHEAGAFYIQEPSAMLPATLLDVDDSGLRVLDLCAAPGGKSTAIADLMRGEGLLVSNEIIPNRASKLSENIERMGVVNALVCSHDPAFLADRFPVFFDRIMVDAPCSGEGMFRKNPEAVDEWSEENVKMCADRQDMILDCAARMLSPGGTMVYSTCTFSREEDEGSVERFLSSHPEFCIKSGPHRIFPHTSKGEGHFAVSFVRSGKSIAHSAMQARSKKKKVLTGPEEALLNEFIQMALSENSDITALIKEGDRLVKFGESLYLAPDMMPDLSGLKVYRAGLKLGTFAKNRFEPDHALSHALKPSDVKYYVNNSWDSPEIKNFISGMTINCDPAIKGWCLVCVEGLPLSWGKADRGIIKNHYPKGLRR